MKELKQFVYPAVFRQGEFDVVVYFPDLELTTEGENYEEAFLFAKDLLRVYLSTALNNDLEFSLPSKFSSINSKNVRNDDVMLIDAFVF